MKLKGTEKELISKMEQCDFIELADYNRSIYQYEVELPLQNEYRVAKFAVMCLDVKYFSNTDEVINYIESNPTA